MKIKVSKAREILAACVQITSGTYTTLAQLANGEKAAAAVPFELDDKARWNLTRNLATCDRIVKDADKLRTALVHELEARNGGKSVRKDENPDLFAEFQRRADAIEDHEDTGKFLRVKLSGLKVSNDNPIPGAAIVALLPVLELDVPESDADVIPDESNKG